MVVAVAIAIALHEILAALVPAPRVEPAEVRERVVSATISAAERTPAPSPTPVAAVVAAAPAQAHALARTVAGASAPRDPSVREGASRPDPQTVSHARPEWDVPMGAQGAGAGNLAATGSTGQGGIGSGSGSQGAGGGGSSAPPCGAVYFQPASDPNPHYDAASGFFVFDRIKMSVHMPDGRVEEAVLDWPWRYRTEDADPFTHRDAPMIFQFPPAAIRASEPPVVQYVITHTASDGTTVLADCPSR